MTSDAHEQIRARISWLLFMLVSFAIVVCHAIYFFTVYRARVLAHSGFASSDLLLIYLPLFIVFAAFALLLRARHTSRVVMLVLAFLFTLLSFWLSILIPFNMYGT